MRWPASPASTRDRLAAAAALLKPFIFLILFKPLSLRDNRLCCLGADIAPIQNGTSGNSVPWLKRHVNRQLPSHMRQDPRRHKWLVI
jgi:hypothetical protein